MLYKPVYPKYFEDAFLVCVCVWVCGVHFTFDRDDPNYFILIYMFPRGCGWKNPGFQTSVPHPSTNPNIFHSSGTVQFETIRGQTKNVQYHDFPSTDPCKHITQDEILDHPQDDPHLKNEVQFPVLHCSTYPSSLSWSSVPAVLLSLSLLHSASQNINLYVQQKISQTLSSLY